MEPPCKKVRFDDNPQVVQDSVTDQLNNEGTEPMDIGGESSTEIFTTDVPAADNFKEEIEEGKIVDVYSCTDSMGEGSEIKIEEKADDQVDIEAVNADIDLPESHEEESVSENEEEGAIIDFLPDLLGVRILPHNERNLVAETDNDSDSSTVIYPDLESPGSTGTHDCCPVERQVVVNERNEQIEMQVRDEPAQARLFGLIDANESGDEHEAQGLDIVEEENEIPQLAQIVQAPEENVVHYNNNLLIDHDSDEDFFERESLCSTLCLDKSFSPVISELSSDESGIINN